MKPLSLCIPLLLIVVPFAQGQAITADIPEQVHSSEKYLFYLHGGVVQQQGVHAVSPYYGAYDYLGILDTLKSHKFHVISEARAKGTDEMEYAQKVARQIDTLLVADIPPGNIAIVGASLGAYIAIEIAYRLKNSRIKYALLGLCSDYALDYFSKYEDKLYGNFLSIYERTDEKGSCRNIFATQPPETDFKEIGLQMGNSHAFLFKPYNEWVLPLVNWINESNDD